jgi:hypothetical protein
MFSAARISHDVPRLIFRSETTERPLCPAEIHIIYKHEIDPKGQCYAPGMALPSSRACSTEGLRKPAGTFGSGGASSSSSSSSWRTARGRWPAAPLFVGSSSPPGWAGARAFFTGAPSSAPSAKVKGQANKK